MLSASSSWRGQISILFPVPEFNPRKGGLCAGKTLLWGASSPLCPRKLCQTYGPGTYPMKYVQRGRGLFSVFCFVLFLQHNHKPEPSPDADEAKQTSHRMHRRSTVGWTYFFSCTRRKYKFEKLGSEFKIKWVSWIKTSHFWLPFTTKCKGHISWIGMPESTHTIVILATWVYTWKYQWLKNHH